MPHDRIVTRKRNKLTIIAAAGALSMATATSAAAWPTGPSAGAAATGISRTPAHAARARLSSNDTYLASQQATLVQGHQVVTMVMRRARQRAEAARKAAAARAAKLRKDAELAAEAVAARKAARKAAAARAAERRAAQEPSQRQAGPQQAAPAAVVPADSGSARSIAQGMLGSFGWAASEFSCLDPLWSAESGWSATASNPSTGAYGIPQALPGSKMASAGPDWEANATTQIRWGLGYIKDTYGSPCAAWSHEQSAGWY